MERSSLSRPFFLGDRGRPITCECAETWIIYGFPGLMTISPARHSDSTPRRPTQYSKTNLIYQLKQLFITFDLIFNNFFIRFDTFRQFVGNRIVVISSHSLRCCLPLKLLL